MKHYSKRKHAWNVSLTIPTITKLLKFIQLTYKLILLKYIYIYIFVCVWTRPALRNMIQILKARPKHRILRYHWSINKSAMKKHKETKCKFNTNSSQSHNQEDETQSHSSKLMIFLWWQQPKTHITISKTKIILK